MRAKAMLLNTELRKLCGALKGTFVDLSDTLAGEKRLAQDGIHYLSATTRQVATQLAQAIRPFLGLQRPRRSRDKSNRTPRWKSDPNVSSPTSETPATPPPPQPPWNGSRDSQYVTQGVQRQHPGPPPPDVLDEHGTSTDPKHTTMPTEGEPSSADMDTTRGHHPPCNGPMATTQPRCAPRTLPHDGGHCPPTDSCTMATDGQTRYAPKLNTMKRRCRRHRKKKEANANVGFLNIHGGRKRSKWEELYQMLETEKMTLFAVAETHLLGLTEPPAHPNWQ
ncbi:hypothetical protein MRX96_058662 [Rhipicephalus microplus]|uniref:Uncharacterized protein n=1 Tax=Rhipicephalus microplus TaxID=6941 RepID=A0A9J6D033_RHIMP|nr:hypothetical protein HPB51_027546 [Rhipicephalus microplus]